MVGLSTGEVKEVVAVAGEQQVARAVRELEHGFVERVAGQDVAEEGHLMPEVREQVAQIVGDIVVEEEFHSEAGAIWRATRRSISPRWSS